MYIELGNKITMDSNDAIIWLRQLSNEQLEDCRVFITLPSLKLAKDAQRLFEHFYQRKKEGKADVMDRHEVHQALFPNKPFKNSRLSQSASWLKKAVLKYMAFAELDMDEIKQQQLQAQFFKRHHWAKDFSKHHYKLLAHLNRSKYKDFNYHWHCWQSYDELINYQLADIKEGSLVAFDQLLKHADACIAITKLKYGCEQLSVRHIANIRNKDIPKLERFIKEAKMNKKWDEEISIQMLLLLTQLHSEESDIRDYAAAKAYMLENWYELSKEDRLFCFLNLLNHLTLLSNKDSAVKELKRSFTLYKIGFDSGIFPYNDILTDRIFLNVIVNSCLLKEFNFAREIIYKYLTYVKPDLQDNMKALGEAYIDFHDGKYNQVAYRLHKFTDRQPVHTLRAKTLELRAYFLYSIENTTKRREFLTFAKTFKEYLSGNRKISIEKKNSYVNLIDHLRKLSSIHFNESYGGLKKWKIDVVDCKNIVTKKWLLEQGKKLGQMVK